MTKRSCLHSDAASGGAAGCTGDAASATAAAVSAAAIQSLPGCRHPGAWAPPVAAFDGTQPRHATHATRAARLGWQQGWPSWPRPCGPTGCPCAAPQLGTLVEGKPPVGITLGKRAFRQGLPACFARLSFQFLSQLEFRAAALLDATATFCDHTLLFPSLLLLVTCASCLRKDGRGSGAIDGEGCR